MGEEYELTSMICEDLKALQETVHALHVSVEDLVCLLRILADAYVGTLPGIVANQAEKRQNLLYVLRTQFPVTNDLGETIA